MTKLIVNVGSTSVKTQLFDEALNVKAFLNADYGATDGLVVKGENLQGETFLHHDKTIHDAKNTLQVLYSTWQNWLNENHLTVTAMGHRVVHGGANFDKITQITPALLSHIQTLDNYAPLHNPLNRLGIEMAAQLFSNVPQFVVFDTAFHRKIPDYAGRYAIPENLSASVDFYRYGFHGISCQHSVGAAAKMVQKSPENLNAIILHLGGGASATAVKNGISVDTSMGFSPTEGLVMASRSGDIDPMIAITLQREGKSVEDINTLLNKQSGLKGVCGEIDMRTILERAGQGDESCHTALNLFCYRIKKYIGAYFAVLNGNVDALIFTGGIGENAPAIRAQILSDLQGLGFILNSDLNQPRFSSNIDISDTASRSRILVVHAEEEREIALQIQALINQF
jgi:acetate kinase